ncbi:unnamed protein product, partial [Candidula unifasciata]
MRSSFSVGHSFTPPPPPHPPTPTQFFFLFSTPLYAIIFFHVGAERVRGLGRGILNDRTVLCNTDVRTVPCTTDDRTVL